MIERLKMKNYNFKNKKVTVMGLGLHGGGEGLVRYLAEKGAEVLVSDVKSAKGLGATLKNLADLKNVEYHLMGHKWKDFESADIIFLNPAIKKSSLWIKKIQKAKIPISSEMNLFFQLCSGKIIGVTGTNGKSTTAHLIFEILKNKFEPVFSLAGQSLEEDSDQKRVYFGGNIGGSLLRYVDQISKDDLVLLELSSFQLADFSQIKISPHISIILNITPDHLDQHVDFSEYATAKKNILRFQKETDFAILNYDQKIVRKTRGKTPAQILFFSQKGDLNKGAFLEDDKITISFRGKKIPIIDLSELKILGKHNIENILAAVLVGILYSVKPKEISRTLSRFGGLPHRIEFIREDSGVKFYNDSKATTPESTIAALGCFKKPVILICGGREKNTDLSCLAEIIVQRVGYVFLIGEIAAKLESLILKKSETVQKSVLKKVTVSKYLKRAVADAKKKAKKGDVILLSPAASSFDQFENFEQRGNKFKKLVTLRQAQGKGAK